MKVKQPTLFPLYSVEIPSDVPQSNKHLGNPGRRKPIPPNPELIIHDQYYYVRFSRRRKPMWYALVGCPQCGRVFIKRRSNIIRDRSSYCISCARSNVAITPIPQSPECIIVKQSVLGHKDATALAECPICHKRFKKTRGNIRKDNHTICFKCITHRTHSGSNHYNWRGGSGNNYYYGCDWVRLSARIRARDNYRCQYPDCDETRHTQGRALSVHHIVPFNESHDNNPRNLISLCQTHHLWADWNPEESIPMFENIIMMMYGPDY